MRQHTPDFPPVPLRPGDLLSFNDGGLVSSLIALGSWGLPKITPSHVGIITEVGDRGLFLVESTTTFGGDTACRVTGRKGSGVRALFLEETLVRKGRIWHHPLRIPLTPFARYRLSEYLVAQLGKPYDLKGAIRSGMMVRVLARILRKGSLDQMFCSELCAAAWAEAGIMQIGMASFYSPSALIRRSRREAISLAPRRLK